MDTEKTTPAKSYRFPKSPRLSMQQLSFLFAGSMGNVLLGSSDTGDLEAIFPSFVYLEFCLLIGALDIHVARGKHHYTA